VDYVLSVADIPKRVLQYHDRLSQFSSDASRVAPAATDSEGFQQIMRLLRMRTGHDFANYKPLTILRRIQRRLSLVGVGSLLEYADFLQGHADEPAALMKDLLISVTNFFRDTATYASLEKLVVPHIFQGKSGMAHVRVWVAGCATGEEAYSIAMLLAEYASSTPETAPRIQVFASDLDEQAIAIAREGFYTDAEVADVSLERLRRFFFRERGDIAFAGSCGSRFCSRSTISSRTRRLASRSARMPERPHLPESVDAGTTDRYVPFCIAAGRVSFSRHVRVSRRRQQPVRCAGQGPPHLPERAVASRLTLPLGGLACLDLQGITHANTRPGGFRSRVSHRSAPSPIEEYAPPSLVVTDERLLVHESQSAASTCRSGAASRPAMCCS
jgi:hypothetical protein